MYTSGGHFRSPVDGVRREGRGKRRGGRGGRRRGGRGKRGEAKEDGEGEGGEIRKERTGHNSPPLHSSTPPPTKEGIYG